jgi:PAS domain S-box-containing protein
MDAVRSISSDTIKNKAEVIYKSPDKHWFLWAVQDVVLWKIVEFRSVAAAKENMEKIWEIFLSLRGKWPKLYVVIDITEVPILSPEIRQYLLDEWVNLIDRDDLSICSLDSDSFRRILRNSRFRFYKDLDTAFAFIDDARNKAFHAPLPQETEQIFHELVEQHKSLAAIHRQNPIGGNALEDSERQLQDLFEDFPGVVYYFDILGRFRWGNKKAEELCGYNREEVIGKSYYASGLTTAKDLKRLTRIFAESLRKTSTGPHEFTLIRKDNTIRFIEVTAYLMSLPNKKILLYFANDVTERGLQDIFRQVSEEEKKIVAICMHCNMIRDKQDEWHEPSAFYRIYTNIGFSHSICPTCMKKNYPEYADDI